MAWTNRFCRLIWFATLASAASGLRAGTQTATPAPSGSPTPATYRDLPSETPATFVPVTDSFDHVRCDVMIPMRDGVKLHTVILVPKGAKGAPILLTRTPYDAGELTTHAHSSHSGRHSTATTTRPT
jgi:predicted acyl esterase